MTPGDIYADASYEDRLGMNAGETEVIRRVQAEAKARDWTLSSSPRLRGILAFAVMAGFPGVPAPDAGSPVILTALRGATDLEILPRTKTVYRIGYLHQGALGFRVELSNLPGGGYLCPEDATIKEAIDALGVKIDAWADACAAEVAWQYGVWERKGEAPPWESFTAGTNPHIAERAYRLRAAIKEHSP